jgi:cell division protein FtsW (lipid II flippase)
MNRLWQQLAIATNWPVLVAVAVLSALGVASIWADAPDDATKQLFFLGIAAVVMAAVQGVNYLVLGHFAWGLYFFSLLLVLYTVLGGVAEQHHHVLPFVTARNKAHCWITFPGFSFEPSELMKVSYVMVMARYLRFRSNYRALRGFVLPLVLTLAPMLLILKQPALGVATLFLPTMLAMLFVAGAKIRHLLAVVGAGAVLAPIFWLAGQPNVPILKYLPSLVHGYQREYVHGFLSNDPKTMREAGYQQQLALIASGSGGATGKGLGNVPVGGNGKLPDANNDMIFAIIGEQFGLVGSITVLTAYIVLFASGLEIAAATREPFGRLVAVGIVSFLAAQAFLNLMVAMRLFPVTGVTLPFVSSGGSSLLASFIAAGLLLNIGQNRPLVIARDSFEFD